MPLPEPLHKKCLELYRIYCLCGGMPEAVTSWTNTQDFNACLSIQQDLLNTYRDDFSKYGTNSGLLRAAFKSAAAQLGNKFVLGRVAEGVKAEAARKALHQFMFDKQLDSAVRLDTNNFSRLKQQLKTTQGDKVEYTLNSIPVYLAERILELT